MKNISEDNCTLVVMVDGMYFDYKLGDEIEKAGSFVVTLTDEAGNSTTYTFDRIYSLNGASIAVLAGFGALVVLLIALLIKSRHHYYKNEVIEEEIAPGKPIFSILINRGQSIFNSFKETLYTSSVKHKT